MFFKQIDFLSPNISFLYKGSPTHSSIFAGIVSILAFAIIAFYIVYFCIDFFGRRNPTSYFFTQFDSDIPEFILDNVIFPHYVSLVTSSGHGYNYEIDFNSFSIIGVQTPKSFSRETIKDYDHWVYGPCQKSDIEGYEDLINNPNDFYSSACIRKFYNSSEGEYYDIGEPKFKWPILAHGRINTNNQYYDIIVDYCNPRIISSLGSGYTCNSQAVINEKYQTMKYSLMNFVDHYIEMTDYDKPIKHSLFSLSSEFLRDVENHHEILFNPINVKTNDGIFLDNSKKKSIIGLNDIETILYDATDYGLDFYMAFEFRISNVIYKFSRRYKKIQEIISSIGGIHKFISFVGGLIISYYHEYVVLYDTKELIFSMANEKDNKSSPKNVINCNKTENDSFSKFNLGVDKKEINNQNIFNNANRENLSKKEIDPGGTDEISEQEFVKNIRGLNFCNFLEFKFCGCKKNIKHYSVYKNFRSKVISEEQLCKNYLNIYNIMHKNESMKNDYNKIYSLKKFLSPEDK